MKRSEVNRDPERALKRASSDFRCAARKLGVVEAMRLMMDLFGDEIDKLADYHEDQQS